MNIRRKNIIIIIFFIVAIVSLIEIIDYLLPEKDKKNVYKLAYVSSSTKDENLNLINEGILRASKDMNVEVRVHKLVENKEIESQIVLLQKEVQSNTDAILITPIDYEKLAKPIEEASENVPIILINSKINSNKKLPYISCNNYELGVDMAEEVVRRGNARKKILLIKEDINSSNLKEIEDGFRNELKNSKNSVLELTLKGDKDNYYNDILRYIKENEVEIVVSFNEYIIELLANIKKDLFDSKSKCNFELYGYSNSTELISYIEEGIIDGLAIENQFNLGYLGTEMAIKIITNEKIDENEIGYTIINKENMYLEKNQRLIFPFVN